jgi:hypothetical protein
MEAGKLGNEAPHRLLNQVEQAIGEFKDVASQETAILHDLHLEGRSYVGHRSLFEIDAKTNVEIHWHIDRGLLDRLKSLAADPYEDLPLPLSRVFHESDRVISRFSDGTLLEIRLLRKQ